MSFQGLRSSSYCVVLLLPVRFLSLTSKTAVPAASPSDCGRYQIVEGRRIATWLWHSSLWSPDIRSKPRADSLMV